MSAQFNDEPTLRDELDRKGWVKWFGENLRHCQPPYVFSIHGAMDRPILACYGWTDLDPGHGFHQNERGRTRYIIAPLARRDLLRRLLALNLEIAAREADHTP